MSESQRYGGKSFEILEKMYGLVTEVVILEKNAYGISIYNTPTHPTIYDFQIKISKKTQILRFFAWKSTCFNLL